MNPAQVAPALGALVGAVLQPALAGRLVLDLALPAAAATLDGLLFRTFA